MSRIGVMPIKIEDGVQVEVNGNNVSIKGPLGENNVTIVKGITVTVEGDNVVVSRNSEAKKVKSMHGTTRMLISNGITGVKTGYERRLELVGVGYRVTQSGEGISLSLGLNHAIVVQPTDGIKLEVVGETQIIVRGNNKQKVGEMAAKIREVRKPEPYKGKGIRYEGEYVRRKSAKAAA